MFNSFPYTPTSRNLSSVISFNSSSLLCLIVSMLQWFKLPQLLVKLLCVKIPHCYIASWAACLFFSTETHLERSLPLRWGLGVLLFEGASTHVQLIPLYSNLKTCILCHLLQLLLLALFDCLHDVDVVVQASATPCQTAPNYVFASWADCLFLSTETRLERSLPLCWGLNILFYGGLALLFNSFPCTPTSRNIYFTISFDSYPLCSPWVSPSCSGSSFHNSSSKCSASRFPTV